MAILDLMVVDTVYLVSTECWMSGLFLGSC